MKDIKASVIIPAYNAERFICRAIDSALHQTEKNIEVIIVNDGSTDKTEEKCSIYQNNERVHYFSQENGGPASARNHGLRMAQGEFVAFLDADDCLAPEMIERMIAVAETEKADIMICDIEIIECDGNVRYYSDCQEGGVYRNKDVIEEIVPSFLGKIDKDGCIRKHDWSVLRRVFRREVLLNNEIIFNEQLKNSEDCLFTYTATVHASCICYLKNCYYYKNIRNRESLSHKCVWEYWEQRLLLISELQKLNEVKKINISHETWSLFVFMCALASCDNFSKGLATNNKRRCYKKLKEINNNEVVIAGCRWIDSEKLNQYFKKRFLMCYKRKTFNLFLYYLDTDQNNITCRALRRIGRKLRLLY